MHCCFGKPFILFILPKQQNTWNDINYHANDSRIRTGSKKTWQKAIPSILIPEWLPKKCAPKLLVSQEFDISLECLRWGAGGAGRGWYTSTVHGPTTCYHLSLCINKKLLYPSNSNSEESRTVNELLCEPSFIPSMLLQFSRTLLHDFD